MSFGAEIPFLRPKQFAKDSSNDLEYITHAINWLKDEENYIADIIVLLRPTTPFRDSLVIDAAIESFLDNKTASSLRSAHLSTESPFKWFKSDNHFFKPISKELNLEDTNKPRQEFEDIFIPNGYVDIIKVNEVIANNNVYGERILKFITSKSYEIDTIEEFEYIQYLLEKKKTK